MTPTLAQMNGGGNRPNMNRNQTGQQGDMGSQMLDRLLKMQLQNAGYTDEKLQNTVVTYAKNKETARKPLYNTANALSQALANPDTALQDVDAAVTGFNSALNVERDRTKKAEKELDAQIKYSADSRLEAVLTLAGVIGDAGSYLSSPMGRGRGPQGGMDGGPGGDQMGGPGVGMGGPGGQMGGPGGPPPDGGMDDF